MESRSKRHCWECRRRCLVCDFTKPACRRCSAAGVECPGYSQVKPTRLKWLTPGKVTSRSRRLKATSRLGDTKSDYPQATAIETTEILDMRVHVPPFKMMTDICALPQAAEYFNTCIYPDLVPIHQFGQNPHIYPLTAKHLRVGATIPEYVQYGMVCMTLSHRINRTRTDLQASEILLERFYLYWGLATRSLSEYLNVENARTSDMVIVGILTLLLADVQNGTLLNWQCHMEGVHRVISLRGGFHAVAGSKRLEPLLLVLWSVAVIGNTTCPVSDLSMTGVQLDATEAIMEHFAISASPFHMCPLQLYGEIIRINHLRARVLIAKASDITSEADEILERIHEFSPEKWAKSKPQFTPSSTEDWMLLGSVHQSAVAIYCILSLQSISVFPTSQALRARCVAHRQILQTLLQRALPCPKMKRFIIWPLVLLGVEAVHAGTEVRNFVAKHLPQLSRDLGTSVPLTAKYVLERFWGSGETRWDMCFDRPYVFTAQLAVDTSRLAVYDEC